VGILPPDLAGIETAGLIDLIDASRYRNQPGTLVCDGVRPDDAPVGTVARCMCATPGPAAMPTASSSG
jgi:hypothetical protein